jgi:hypothetical protein
MIWRRRRRRRRGGKFADCDRIRKTEKCLKKREETNS